MRSGEKYFLDLLKQRRGIFDEVVHKRNYGIDKLSEQKLFVLKSINYV